MKRLGMTNVPSPLFSVITITFNNLEGLQKTNDSLDAQTLRDFEWIVIDGGSTDQTIEHLQKTKALWTSKPDHGIYDAMNKGIDRATGTYLIFMNAGDQFAQDNTLEIIKNHIEQLPQKPDFIYGDSLEGTERTQHYKPARPHHAIASGMFTHHQAMIYHREKIGALRYNTHYKIAADYDFTLQFLRTAQHITDIKTPICLFESGGISQTNVLIGRTEQFMIRKNNQIPLLKNLCIFCAQTVLYQLRKFSPKVYWFLKQRQQVDNNGTVTKKI